MKSVSEVKLKTVEGFQVEDGNQCGDKVVYAGGCFAAAGLIAGATQGAYPQFWPKVSIRGPKIMMTFYLMGRHSITWGLAAAAFAAGACLTAKYRNKEGVSSCLVGGVLGGVIFGIRYRATHSVAWTTTGIGILMATMTSVFKLFHGSYLPVMPEEQPKTYMLTKRKEYRDVEMKEINAQREIEYQEWKNRQ
ncbi:hypothetical protein LOD99_15435 [Oopsacas minuta]|uniref:NADH dehydrogenase [ubiquinone] 1 alpha subcomplex subunit 11 n=1 Tax=Oopsacas minuta TaxID=111878 RepID=A0AAV7KBL3_9METZ|nr:hypothetical protein LOD99_15435 [Oopsacas minuta]